MLEDAIPYPLTRVEDDVSQMVTGGLIPEGFYAQRYYVMRGPTMVAAIDTAFNEQDGLVNFSFVLRPREFFKRRAATAVFRNHVVPYVRAHVGTADWVEAIPGQHWLADRQGSLLLAAKFYFGGGMKSFGLAVTELRYSGVEMG